MPRSFRVALASLLLVPLFVTAQTLTGRRPTVADDHPIDAAWSFENGPLLRLYEGPVDCPNRRPSPNPYSCSSPRGNHGRRRWPLHPRRVAVDSVILPDQTVLLCRSGEVRVVAAANNELRGDYALTLSDGQLRTGHVSSAALSGGAAVSRDAVGVERSDGRVLSMGIPAGARGPCVTFLTDPSRPREDTAAHWRSPCSAT